MRGRWLAAALLLGDRCAGMRSARQQARRARPAAASRSPGGSPSQFKKELGLTADQSARIDEIWETTRPELRQEWDELRQLEDKLSRLIQNDADEARARAPDRPRRNGARQRRTRPAR